MSTGAQPLSAPATARRAAIVSRLLVLSALLIGAAGILLLACIGVAAAFHHAGMLAPAAVGTACGLALWSWVAGLGGFPLFLALDLLVGRR